MDGMNENLKEIIEGRREDIKNYEWMHVFYDEIWVENEMIGNESFLHKMVG